MDLLTTEVRLDDFQFGGVKGSGTEHLITELLTDQMECLDDTALLSP